MVGIVSLLDESHTDLVTAIWSELDRDFGLKNAALIPYPHITYHVAGAYDSSNILSSVAKIAAATAPFVARTSGLGIFSGSQPVLYVAVVRSDPLSRLHASLGRILDPMAINAELYSSPGRWVPHITIALDDAAPEKLAAVVRSMAGRDFAWDIHVDNLALLDEVDGINRPTAKWALGFG